MALGDLTTLSNVQNWRTPLIASSADDAAISREIAAASRAVLKHCNRKSIGYGTYVETRNGMGTQGLKLREYPVNVVSAVSVCGVVIPPVAPAPSSGYGYVFDQEFGMLYLRGYCFDLGFQNVMVAYTAGFLQDDEDQTIPASSPYTIPCSQLSELWFSAAYVYYSDGGARLTPVAEAPLQGQYVPPTGPDGYYQFNIADASASVDISYGWTPKDVEEACITMVILEYNRRSRIGENSKVLAGENVNYYSQAALTPTIESRLRNYVNEVPNP
jgi:hypothetical protein